MILALTSNVEYGQARLAMQEETIKDLVSRCDARGAAWGQVNCWLAAGLDMNCAAGGRYFMIFPEHKQLKWHEVVHFATNPLGRSCKEFEDGKACSEFVQQDALDVLKPCHSWLADATGRFYPWKGYLQWSVSCGLSTDGA